GARIDPPGEPSSRDDEEALRDHVRRLEEAVLRQNAAIARERLYRERALEEYRRAEADWRAQRDAALSMGAVVPQAAVVNAGGATSGELRDAIDKLRSRAAELARQVGLRSYAASAVETFDLPEVAAASRSSAPPFEARVWRERVDNALSDVPFNLAEEDLKSINGAAGAVLASRDAATAEAMLADLIARIIQTKAKGQALAKKQSRVRDLMEGLAGLTGQDVDQVRAALKASLSNDAPLEADLEHWVGSVKADAKRRVDRDYIAMVTVQALRELGFSVPGSFKTELFGGKPAAAVSPSGDVLLSLQFDAQSGHLITQPVGVDGAPVTDAQDDEICELVLDELPPMFERAGIASGLVKTAPLSAARPAAAAPGKTGAAPAARAATRSTRR
ncbi:MAG: hypothetical protein QM608_01015, partial [Caulobacter sp.]